MKRKITKPETGHEYLAETLQQIVADPGQFVADGWVQSSNAPDESRLCMTLLGYNESEIALTCKNGLALTATDLNVCKIAISSGSDDLCVFEGLGQFAFAAGCTGADMREALTMLTHYLNDLTRDPDYHAIENAEESIQQAINDPAKFIDSCPSTFYEKTDHAESVTLNAPGCQLQLSKNRDLISISALRYGAADLLVGLASINAIKNLCTIDADGDSEFVNIGIASLISLCYDRQVITDRRAAAAAGSAADRAAAAADRAATLAADAAHAADRAAESCGAIGNAATECAAAAARVYALDAAAAATDAAEIAADAASDYTIKANADAAAASAADAAISAAQANASADAATASAASHSPNAAARAAN